MKSDGKPVLRTLWRWKRKLYWEVVDKYAGNFPAISHFLLYLTRNIRAINYLIVPPPTGNLTLNSPIQNGD